MHRIALIFSLMLLLCGTLYAYDFTVSFSPSSINLNVLNTAAFDPINPANQPLLTTLNIRNISSEPKHYYLHLKIIWNSTTTTLINSFFAAKNPLAAGNSLPPLSNRDLISTNASTWFHEPNPSISLQDVIASSSVLSNALQSGCFPDGTLSIIAEITQNANGNTVLSNTATCDIRIKNISSIFLTYPGRPLGQTPPVINLRPVTFLWNSIKTGFNDYRIQVKEFLPTNPPSIGNIDTSGRTIYTGTISSGTNVFDEFLPFQENYFYAWRVSTLLTNEANLGNNNAAKNSVNSLWYVFQYKSNEGGQINENLQLQALLNMLNAPIIQSLISQGFRPTGIIIMGGQVYSGQAAIDLLSGLQGKTFEVEIKEQ